MLQDNKSTLASYINDKVKKADRVEMENFEIFSKQEHK
jgi:hypothetical protein